MQGEGGYSRFPLPDLRDTLLEAVPRRRGICRGGLFQKDNLFRESIERRVKEKGIKLSMGLEEL